jgi:hypothetical protein
MLSTLLLPALGDASAVNAKRPVGRGRKKERKKEREKDGVT